jgi:peptide deformylase
MKILQKDNPILRKKSKKIEIKEITSPKIKKLIKEIKKTLDSEETGAALASPQIGVNKRFFIVSEKVYEEDKIKNLVFINPKIIKLSKKTEWKEEGCLSVKNIYGKVKRAKNCTITAYDENGKKFTRGAGGLLSQIFQHEVDHLNGILFIDKAKDLKEINDK